MGNISSEDKELAARAKAKAGGPTALGKILGVSKQTASEYGRTQPVPRHVRERLRAYLGEEAETARGLKALWQMEGVRDRRWFTSLVEDLRRIDRMGRGKTWITAWTTIKAAAQILRTLDDADDETHWKAIFGEDGPPIDHWKRLTGKTEVSLTREE